MIHNGSSCYLLFPISICMTLSPLSRTNPSLPPIHCMFCWQKFEFIFRAYKNTQADNRPYSDNYRTNLKNMSKFWTISFFKSQQSGLSSIFVSFALGHMCFKIANNKKITARLFDWQQSEFNIFLCFHIGLFCDIRWHCLPVPPTLAISTYSVHWCFLSLSFPL